MKGLICAGWADENRRGIPRAENLSAGINVGHVNEAARAQLEFLETFPIGTQGHFIVDAGRHVAEVRRRYVFSHERLKVEYVDRILRACDCVLQIARSPD